MSDTPTFEDWVADRGVVGLESFLLIHHTAVWDEWRDRLQREYYVAFGLTEPDWVADLLDDLGKDLLDSLEYPKDSQQRIARSIELFTKLKQLWQEDMKKDKNHPHYAKVYRLLKTVCVEGLGISPQGMENHFDG